MLLYIAIPQVYCLNVDRATLKEPLQEIINTAEEEGTSRLVAPVDHAAPALKETSPESEGKY